MSKILLNKREETILQAVVHSFITTAEPAGSRGVVKRYDLDISPATVRNVMADLEEGGFLQQLHTSSGRVPTDKGYRYYVDYLMSVQDVTRSEQSRIEEELAKQLDDADDVLRQTSHLLALISHQTGIVEAPGLAQAELRHLDLVPLEGDRIVVLLTDNYGRVRTIVSATKGPLSLNEAARLSRFLNENFSGMALDRLVTSVQARMRQYMDEERRMAERALEIIGALPVGGGRTLYLDGATQLFEQPEFHDLNKAREVFGLLEEQDRVTELLRMGLMERDPRQSHVVIGLEARQHGMEDISVVSAPYKIAGNTVGVVGVLGPRRMPYWRLSGIVEYTASMLGRFLTRLAH